MQLNWPEPTGFPELSAETIHVWALPLNGIRASFAEMEATLSPIERNRLRNIAFDKPRITFVAARAALRSLLGRYLDQPSADVQILNDSNGKPRLVDRDLCFNLAHSGDLTLIAVTRGAEIGVDVELLRTVDHLHEIAARNFHSAERHALRDADASQTSELFLRCWTRKEAVLKTNGVGLGYPLDSFCVLTNRVGSGSLELPPYDSLSPVTCWWHDLEPCSGYLAAVSTSKPASNLQGFTYHL